ncbi:MAG: Response regulator of zinc sigma-54-dependent two-component system [Myxococcaceae bacterium]|nr:Response regulator of zinc sigma-54-dependent two-component system [Myxococcaceae bacterium]
MCSRHLHAYAACRVDQHRTDTSAFLAANADCRATARLLVEQPDRAPRVVVLPVGAEVRVGRGESVEVLLDDHRASRVHAVLRFDGRAVTVRDEGSSNGTFVDGARVTGSRRVEDGERIEIGGSKIVVLLTLSGAPRPTAIAPVAASSEVVAVDPLTVSLFALVRRLAASDISVLVQGETGAGKELVARALHRDSLRASKPFVAINCATLTESIAASELFGHERGSFSGADARKVGVFESADGGTLLLDEVGELSPPNQALLLRALQEGSIRRVGSSRPVAVDVRVVSASNRDLALEVAQGRFRQDLYFRLNGVTVQVPALRARTRDILPMVERILAGQARAWRLGPGVAAALEAHPWVGNARELRNVVLRGMALADRDEIRLEHLLLGSRDAGAGGPSTAEDPSAFRAKIEETERRAIVTALTGAGGNQSQAARELGISRRCLITRMERYGLKPKPVSIREV